MGQYYRVALTDNEWKVKVIQPDGWKLMEHAYYGSRTMKRIEKILYRDAYNVHRIGDYSEVADLVWKFEFPNMEKISYDRKLSKDEVLEREWWDYYYLVNKFKKEFINMTKQEMREDLQDRYGWVVHPLPILCRASWEFWWGDYYWDAINQEYMWAWCWDMISVYHNPWMELEEYFKKDWYEDKTDVYFFKE